MKLSAVIIVRQYDNYKYGSPFKHLTKRILSHILRETLSDYVLMKNGLSDKFMKDAALVRAPESTVTLRLVPASLRSAVEDRVRQSIVTGELLPGTHLSDRMMCERFGVSRTIIREAIRLLEAEGLVTVLPHRGPFVAFLSAAEAVQIYELRAALEALAGQNFAERASDEERAALRAVVKDLETFGVTDTREMLLERKRAFYAILLNGSRNQYAARMLGLLLNRNSQLRAISLSSPDRLPDTIRELWRIVDAIEQRDGEGAAAACRDHVRTAAAIAMKVLRERENTASGADAAPSAPAAPSQARRARVRSAS